jgi:hypothetical protein
MISKGTIGEECVQVYLGVPEMCLLSLLSYTTIVSYVCCGSATPITSDAIVPLFLLQRLCLLSLSNSEPKEEQNAAHTASPSG